MARSSSFRLPSSSVPYSRAYMAHSGILSHSVFFMCAAIAYRLCGGKSADYLLKFLFPFPVAIAEGWIGKLVPVVVIEEFHPQRIVVEYFPAVPKDADMIYTYVHGL